MASPMVRRKRLAAELRAIRESTGKSARRLRSTVCPLASAAALVGKDLDRAAHGSDGSPNREASWRGDGISAPGASSPDLIASRS